MKLPEIFKVLVITLSDRASAGEYEDLSGPRVADLISDFFRSAGKKCSVERKLIGDDETLLKEIIERSRSENHLIITTGGTGLGPRDITVDVVKKMLTRELPGIMEYIRIKYGTVKPNALLSRGVAGTIGNCLVYTLPGSQRAVEEYMNEITRTLEHTFFMIYGIDTHKG